MANDGSPGAPAGGGGAQPQMAPSSFDAAMSQMDVPLIHGDAPAPNTPPPQQTSSRTAKPALTNAEALPDTGGVDPNDPAELAARDALKSKGQPEDPADPSKSLQEQAESDAKSLDEWMKAKDDIMLSELFEDKLVEVPWGEGKTKSVPVSEMKNGYMRQLDYTRNQQRVAQVERQAQQHNQNINRFLTDLSNPQTMRATLEDLGYGEIFETAAQGLYQERLEQEKIFYDLQKKGASPEHLKLLRENAMAARASNVATRKLTRERDAALAQRQQEDVQAQQNQEAQQLSNQLAQLRPAAFKRLQMPDDAVHQAAFQEQFLAILQVGGGKGRHLREIVLDAANAAKQYVEDRVGNYQVQAEQERQRAAGQAQPFSPQRLAGPAPREGNGVTPARQKRLGLGDFDSEMARMNGGGR